MFANHPAMAKRWAALTDQSSLPEKAKGKDSAGTPPGSRTGATDFKPLKPGPKARHRLSVPSKEQDSMKEGPISFVPGSRGHHLDKFKRKGA